MMTTTERQEVAEKLRENSTAHTADEALQIICKCTVRTMKGSKSVMEVLADLIDPTCRIYYTDTSTDTPDHGYEPDGYYSCSCCGELDDYFAEIWDTYQAHGYEGEPPFRYCPHCGARVVIPGE